jgi:hypothetical protein
MWKWKHNCYLEKYKIILETIERVMKLEDKLAAGAQKKRGMVLLVYIKFK